jgi:cytochrome c oxidase assembly protein Cox11
MRNIDTITLSYTFFSEYFALLSSVGMKQSTDTRLNLNRGTV